MAEPLHTIDEVADFLHQRPSTIRTWIRDGRLQGTPIGKSWFVMDSDLQAFMVRQRDEAAAELARRREKATKAAQTRKTSIRGTQKPEK